MNSTDDDIEEIITNFKNTNSASFGFLWSVLTIYSGLIIVGCIGNLLVFVVAVQEKGEQNNTVLSGDFLNNGIAKMFCY